MASSSEIWPSAPIVISSRTKQLISRFFEISDSTDLASGKLMADGVFAKDGIFTTHKTLVSKGYDEIAACRGKNNPDITSRSHHLFRVYVANSPATELIVLGNFIINHRDGKQVVLYFSGRFVVVAEQNEERLKFVQIWTDTVGMIAGFDNAGETLIAQK